MSSSHSSAVPEVDPRAFAAYYRKPGSIRASDDPGMSKRCTSLMSMIDQRLWKTDGGGYTHAVRAAAAAAKCDWNTGFDVEDLVARAVASPRPPLERIDEPGYTEPMLLCNKCGAWWRESQSEAHRPGC